MEVFSIVLSPLHPNLSDVYNSVGINQHCYNSERKAIQALRTLKPDFVVADFLYGYGNNYAGVNVSNLDVMLYSFQKSAPDVQVFLLCEKKEIQFTKKLPDVVSIAGEYVYPLCEKTFREDLGSAISRIKHE